MISNSSKVCVRALSLPQLLWVWLDKPKFGEVVHEPPALTLPRRSKVDPLKVNETPSPSAWHSGDISRSERRVCCWQRNYKRTINVDFVSVDDDEMFLFCLEHANSACCRESDQCQPWLTASISRRSAMTWDSRRAVPPTRHREGHNEHCRFSNTRLERRARRWKERSTSALTDG